jgi:hypothetical protein
MTETFLKELSGSQHQTLVATATVVLNSKLEAEAVAHGGTMVLTLGTYLPVVGLGAPSHGRVQVSIYGLLPWGNPCYVSLHLSSRRYPTEEDKKRPVQTKGEVSS